ncbi:MAG: recombinase family protein, partial [Planctomycetes bacterium]|nr:recombinase family protein [Planctomycetota bacterium]
MSKPAPKTIRCAVYTRKSSAEGLEQEFNSLDAQRLAGEAYIASQAGAGWVCLPDRYDDGGFTGGNMDRPALKRLIADVTSGGMDCVVIYKIDRLSRSLIDFTRMIELLEKHEVSLVAVTQQINTSTSTGRLMLNILSSFAQFEREIISERTRDKIAAARRSGYWSGGIPPLGYDIDRSSGSIRLVVIPSEADRVRRIFELYLQQRSLLKVTRILDQRGWRTKRWVTRKGQQRGGRRFEKSTLLYLLRNITGCGKLRHRGEVHEGRHEAVIPEELYNHVQALLDHNGPPRNHSRHSSGAMLNGLLFCAHCDRAMTHSSSTNGSRRYRYYVCTQASRRGWDTCPSKSLPAGVIEQFVIDQLLAPGMAPEIATGIEDIDECERQVLTELALQWDKLNSDQRHDALHRLVKRVEYEGATGTLRLTIML